MKVSKALLQTYRGIPDFPGHSVVTVSAGGPGWLADCLKCCECGHSVIINAKSIGITPRTGEQ